MPLYQFKCTCCGADFEALVTRDEERIGHYPHCPLCFEKTEKQLTFPSNYFIKGDNSSSTRPRKGQK